MKGTMIEKGIIFNIFKHFIKHEMMQKVISCVVIFFILINLTNLLNIGKRGDFFIEAFDVGVKELKWQVSSIYGCIVKYSIGIIREIKFTRGVLYDMIYKGDRERELVFIEGEGARGSDRGEQTVEGNSLMASVGYLMLTDIYEMGIGIKEAKRAGDRFSEGKGIIKRDIEIEEGRYFKGESISLGSGGEIRKEKEGKLLLAKELSMIGLRDNNILTGKEEGINKKINNRLSLLN